MARHNGESGHRLSTSKDIALSLPSAELLRVVYTAFQFYSYCCCSTTFSPPAVKHIVQLRLSVLMFPICKNKSSRSQLLRPSRLTSYLPLGTAERSQSINRRIFAL